MQFKTKRARMQNTVLAPILHRLIDLTEKADVKKRNSLIEFFRFLFAMNVVIGHGFLPVELNHFGPDRISVEFFFILSGFLFCNSLIKISDMSTGEAVKTILISKIKPILIPTVIGMICNGILNYLTDFTPVFEVFRYLWYIPAMLAIMVVYAILRTLIKKDFIFWWVVAILCVLTTILRFSGSEALFYFDYIRSTASVSLGMLMAKLPKPAPKHKITPWITLIPIALATFMIIYLSLAKTDVRYEAILDLLLYPLLIYVAFGIDLHFAPFNYLGGISFGIYAFQCPARLIKHLGEPDSWLPFVLIILLAVLYNMIARVVKYYGAIKRERKI